jgi:hypothetical protein
MIKNINSGEQPEAQTIAEVDTSSQLLKKPHRTKEQLSGKESYDRKNVIKNVLIELNLNLSIEDKVLEWEDKFKNDDPSHVVSSVTIANQAIRMVDAYDFHWSLYSIVCSGAFFANLFLLKTFNMADLRGMNKFISVVKQMLEFELQLGKILKQKHAHVIEIFLPQSGFKSEKELLRALVFELLARAYQGGFLCGKKQITVASDLVSGVTLESKRILAVLNSCVTEVKPRELGRLLSVFIHHFSIYKYTIIGYLSDKFSPTANNANYLYLKNDQKGDSSELREYKKIVANCGLNEIHSNNPLIGPNVKRALARHKQLLNLNKK